MLHCSDGSFYIGSTNDVSRRVHQHATGRGARYTRGRSPLGVVFIEPAASRSEACANESKMKKLARATKCAMAAFHLQAGRLPEDGLSFHEEQSHV